MKNHLVKGFGIVVLTAGVIALCLGIAVQQMQHQARACNPSPKRTVQVQNEGEFPEVDWSYWLSVNEDIVAWITVPGTEINHPIVQARPSNPERYLHTDVNGNWNPWGAIYVAAECAEEGLDSANVVICGHNMDFDKTSMFAPFARFIDPAYAADHVTILLQTPNWKRVLSVDFIQVIAGWDALKRTSFVDKADFDTWYNGCLSEAAIVLENQSQAPSINYTFCTCSYNYFDSERTLIFAHIEQHLDITPRE